MGLDQLLNFTIVGLVVGCIYALDALGVVVTYTTSGIFNFAHGGIGMILTFAYWDLAVNHGLPQPVALIIVLGILAPLFGAVIERLLMRNLNQASIGTTLAVTLGLLIALIGLGNLIWDQSQSRSVPNFFAGHQVPVGGVNVSWHQILVLLVAVGVVIGLRLLFYRTRPGIAMRAVVDDPELAAMNGATPARVSQMSWAIGAVLAGAAGILLAPSVGMQVTTLTLVVLNAFAATVVGRLKNLPLTFVGAIVLGLLTSYAVWIFSSVSSLRTLAQYQPAIPTLFLLIALLFVPQAKLKAGRLTGGRTPRVPGLTESIVAGAALVVAVWVISGHLSPSETIQLGLAMGTALVALSLVLLTGWGGQVSLCQLTFVGVGAFIMGKTAGGHSILGLVLAVTITAAVGAVVALFALRVQALYLALATLAFAQAMDLVFFQNARVFGFGGRLPVGRIGLFGQDFGTDRSFVVIMALLFAALAVGILALKRGPFGRRLAAMSDSPAACATLGLNLTATKFIAFTLSAALAGLAGVFFGGMKTSVGTDDFATLQSLSLLLVASIGGINTVSGALIGGLSLGLFPIWQAHVEILRGGSTQYLLTGLGAISLARYPNGIVGQVSERFEEVRNRFAASRRARPEPVRGEVERVAGVAS